MHTIPAGIETGVADESHSARTDCTRRGFLKEATCSIGAAVLTVVVGDFHGVLASEPTGRSSEPVREYDWTRHAYIYLIDTRKCIGCGACVRACAQENNVPTGYFRTWVERYHVRGIGEPVIDSRDGGINGFEPTPESQYASKAFFVPKLCNQCVRTPCIQMCPVGASYRTLDGVVLVDEKRCIGCGYCVQACPYGSRFMHPKLHTASKCTLCYHRLTRGLTTACVQACPVGARMVGDGKRVGDKVLEIITTDRVAVLQPELLTEPNCYYLGITKEVR